MICATRSITEMTPQVEAERRRSALTSEEARPGIALPVLRIETACPWIRIRRRDGHCRIQAMRRVNAAFVLRRLQWKATRSGRPDTNVRRRRPFKEDYELLSDRWIRKSSTKQTVARLW